MLDRHLFGIMASYELGDIEFFYEKTRAFRDYINNGKGMEQLGDDYKTSYRNFLKIAILIEEYPRKSYDKTVLLATLEVCNGLVAESKWLKKLIPGGSKTFQIYIGLSVKQSLGN